MADSAHPGARCAAVDETPPASTCEPNHDRKLKIMMEELDEVLQDVPVIDTDASEVRWAQVWGECGSRD
jgi:hypothetical protein